jgi:hypothetical protein
MKYILPMLFVARAAFAQATPETLAEAARESAEAAQKAAEAAALSAKVAQTIAGPASMPVEAAPPPVVVVNPNHVKWAGGATLAAVYLTGNSNSFTGEAGLRLSLLTGPWTVGLKGAAIYGEAKPVGDTRSVVTASNANLELRGARDVAKFLGIFVLGGVGYDRVAKIESRSYGEAGISVIFIKRLEGDLLKTLLELDVGARYQHEEWFQYYPDASGAGNRRLGPQDMLFVHVGEIFRYAIDKRTTFGESLDLLPDLINEENFNLAAAAQLTVKLVGPLSLGVQFLAKFDNLPPPGAQKLDTQLSLNADIAF